MPSQYQFPLGMYQRETVPSKSQDFIYLLYNDSQPYLELTHDDSEFSPNQCIGYLPTSSLNGSLMDIPIDTSSFMNLSLPWEDSQFSARHTNTKFIARASFESSSSTVQGSYCSGNTLSLLDSDGQVVKSSEVQARRESTLLPPNIQDLEITRIDSDSSRPTRLRSSSEHMVKSSKALDQFISLSKTSATLPQLKALASTPEAKFFTSAHTPQHFFDNDNSIDQPTTPSLSFSSTVIGSPSRSKMSSHPLSKDLPPTPVENVATGKIINLKSRSRSSSNNKKLAELDSLPVHRNISGPELDLQYPSMMDAGVLLEPQRQTPKPPSSTDLPTPPPIPADPVEPASYLDWDSDDERPKMIKARSLLNLRSKDASAQPAKSMRRSNKESTKIATGVLAQKSGLRTSSATITSATRTSQSTAHVSISSPGAATQTFAAAAMVMKKSSVLSRKTRRNNTVSTTKQKKTEETNKGPPTKSSKKLPGRRFRAWFQRVFR